MEQQNSNTQPPSHFTEPAAAVFVCQRINLCDAWMNNGCMAEHRNTGTVVISALTTISASMENWRRHIWERVEWNSPPGTMIDIRSQSFEPHENLDNIAEACLLEFHAALMKTREKLGFLTAIEMVMAPWGNSSESSVYIQASTNLVKECTFCSVPLSGWRR